MKQLIYNNMKTYILPLLMMMLISCSNSKTQENESTTVPLPEGKEIYIPKDLRSMDLQDPRKQMEATTAWHVPKTSSSFGRKDLGQPVRPSSAGRTFHESKTEKSGRKN